MVSPVSPLKHFNSNILSSRAYHADSDATVDMPDFDAGFDENNSPNFNNSNNSFPWWGWLLGLLAVGGTTAAVIFGMRKPEVKTNTVEKIVKQAVAQPAPQRAEPEPKPEPKPELEPEISPYLHQEWRMISRGQIGGEEGQHIGYFARDLMTDDIPEEHRPPQSTPMAWGRVLDLVTVDNLGSISSEDLGKPLAKTTLIPFQPTGMSSDIFQGVPRTRALIEIAREGDLDKDEVKVLVHALAVHAAGSGEGQNKVEIYLREGQEELARFLNREGFHAVNAKGDVAMMPNVEGVILQMAETTLAQKALPTEA